MQTKEANLIEITRTRALATVLIVLGHSFAFYAAGEGSWRIHSAVGIPAYGYCATLCSTIGLASFVIISGYLYAYFLYFKGRYTDSKTFLLKKYRRLLVPYIIWGATQIVLMPDQYGPSTLLNGAAHLWFLPMLAVVFTVFALTKRLWFKASTVQETLLLAALVALFALSKALRTYGIFPPPILKQALYFMPLFYLGMLTAKENLRSKLDRQPLYARYIYSLSAIGIISVCIVLGIKVGINMFSSAVLVLLMLSVFATKSCNKSLPTAVKSIADNSMAIYVLHHILIWFAIRYACVANTLTAWGYWGAPAIFLVAFSVSWISAVCIRKTGAYKLLFG